MVRYVALIHKDPDSCYGVSFPDLPGIYTGGDSMEEAIEQAGDVLSFAAEDWVNDDGTAGFKPPRTLDELRRDPVFAEDAKGATIVMIELESSGDAAE
jgi:predicted RNase H-like HicB family nuclease